MPERPSITLSWAQGIDGSIAAAPGLRTSLSGPDSMRMTHALRARHEAILVGIGTLLADDPSLSVRLVEGKSPRPIVLDAGLRTPPGSKFLADRDRKPIIFGAKTAATRQLAHRLEDAGALVVFVDRDVAGGLDLAQVLATLYREDISSLMVEGGAKVLASFLGARLVDEIVVTIAPTILGGLTPFAARQASPNERSDQFDQSNQTAGENRFGQGLPCSLADSKIAIFGPDVVISGRPFWP